MSIPLNIILTKPKDNKYESLYFICTDLDDCYNKIIVSVKNLISLKVNYPDDYEEFKNIIWYETVSFDNDIFEYSIFHENKWMKPWSHQEIYDKIKDIIYNVDIQDSIYEKKNSNEYNSDSDEDQNEHNH